ncbi:MAG: glycosyltransferase family 4 protein, partial [Solirubrobacterales bacterium]|nr:glycosyltransferase family 4 protein [Solirubrobacterales bacterium]
MFPAAPIFTSLYRADSTFPEFASHRIVTSFLDRLPVDRGFRALLPAYPLAMRSLGPIDADVVIASSSAWAHGIRTTERAFHVVYCHNPARWLYGAEYLGENSARHRLAKPAFAGLRPWDQRAARRADLYIANSENTRRRIHRIYGRDSVVVHPPVDTERFAAGPRGERLLVVSRLLPYKRVDLAVVAATRLGLPLDVVGVGPSFDDLRRLAGPTVAFHGKLPDADITRLMQECRALFLCGEEDFGMTPVEAQAAGKPVIAFAAGGALETVEDGFSGVFFSSHDIAMVADAIRRCDDLDADPSLIAERAQRFSRAALRENL